MSRYLNQNVADYCHIDTELKRKAFNMKIIRGSPFPGGDELLDMWLYEGARRRGDEAGMAEHHDGAVLYNYQWAWHRSMADRMILTKREKRRMEKQLFGPYKAPKIKKKLPSLSKEEIESGVRSIEKAQDDFINETLKGCFGPELSAK